MLYEGGVAWLPHISWRFDKNWKAQHGEVPWVVRPPSEYIREHVYLSTYPLEALPTGQLAQLIEMAEVQERLLFAGNYPHQELGDPRAMLDDVPPGLHSGLLGENARRLYGGRLLASNRA